MSELQQVLTFQDFPGRSLTVLLFKDVTNSKWVPSHGARHQWAAAAAAACRCLPPQFCRACLSHLFPVLPPPLQGAARRGARG